MELPQVSYLGGRVTGAGAVSLATKAGEGSQKQMHSDRHPDGEFSVADG